MHNDDALFKKIQELLAIRRFGVLATQGDVYPYPTLVAFSADDDSRHLLFCTSINTRKYQNLSSHHQASMLITSETNSPADLENAEALTVLGTCSELNKERPQAVAFINKHPYLQEFFQSPSTKIISIKVKKYILVTHFQTVMEYSFE